MNALEIIRDCHKARIELSVRGDLIDYDGPRAAVARMLPALRRNKAHVIHALRLVRDAQVDAQLQALLDAAMRACDHWGDGPEGRAATRADIEATPREQRAELPAHLERSYPGRAPTAEPKSTAKQAKWANRAFGRLSGAAWVPLAEAYYLHHWQCTQCCAAGSGHGERCVVGSDLWTAYSAKGLGADPSSIKP